MSPEAFITELREEMRGALSAIDTALPKLDWLQITDRGKIAPIRLGRRAHGC